MASPTVVRIVYIADRPVNYVACYEYCYNHVVFELYLSSDIVLSVVVGLYYITADMPANYVACYGYCYNHVVFELCLSSDPFVCHGMIILHNCGYGLYCL